ncbi:PF13372 domain protein [Leptospira santarosai]|nr:PF13372 domain protein [Leptospira santarosai]
MLFVCFGTLYCYQTLVGPRFQVLGPALNSNNSAFTRTLSQTYPRRAAIVILNRDKNLSIHDDFYFNRSPGLASL